MKGEVSDIILAAITGDAAGYTLNGMKKNHIKAVFREISGYIDPAPGLKNNMQRWKKPGLYSSISQNLLITAACIEKKSFNAGEYIKAFQNAPEISGTPYSIFRDPGEAERNFIYRTKNGGSDMQRFDYPCSRLLPASIPFLMIKIYEERTLAAIKYISLFTDNTMTQASSLLLLKIIEYLLSDKEKNILETAFSSAESLKNELQDMQGKIFSTGHNPDYIISSTDALTSIFSELSRSRGGDNYEEIICRHASKNYGRDISRGSVNLPDTVLPMAVVLSDRYSEPDMLFEMALREGGASSSIVSLAFALSAAYYGNEMPANLTRDMANKKRIHTLVDLAGDDKNRLSVINEIYTSEQGLTVKEIEEHRAKNRNLPQKTDNKKKKTRADIESELSRHVVESWTKLDKAKWKKERKRDNS